MGVMVKKYLGYIFAIIAVIIWGSGYIIKEVVLQYITPIQIVFSNTSLAALILFIYIKIAKKDLRISRRSLIYAAASGVFGMSACQSCTNTGISLVGGVVSSVIFATVPSMCLLIDVFVQKQKTSAINLVAVVTSFIGVALVVISEGALAFNLLGYAFLFTTNVLWILYCYLQGKIDFNVDKTVILFYQLLSAAIFISPVLIVQPFSVEALLTPQVFICILFLAIPSTLAGFLMFNYAIATIGVTQSNVISNFMSVVSLYASVLFFKEAIKPLQLFGVVVVVISIITFISNSNKDLKKADKVLSEQV